MKVVSSLCEFFLRRFSQNLIQTFAVLLLAGLFAACVALPPPTAETPTTTPPAGETSTPQDESVPCDLSMPYAMFPFQRSEANDFNEGPFVFENGAQTGLRTTQIRLASDYSDGNPNLWPVEICPLLSEGVGICSGHTQLTAAHIDQLRNMAGGDVFELIRFEVVDRSKMDNINPEELTDTDLMTETLTHTFSSPVEIWIPFDENDMDKVNSHGGGYSSLAHDVPGIGYWSCVDANFAWKEFQDVRIVVEVNSNIDIQWFNPHGGVSNAMAGFSVEEVGAEILKVTEAGIFGTDKAHISVAVEPGQHNLREFLEALASDPQISEIVSPDIKTYLVATTTGWNDPALGMQP